MRYCLCMYDSIVFSSVGEIYESKRADMFEVPDL